MPWNPFEDLGGVDVDETWPGTQGSGWGGFLPHSPAVNAKTCINHHPDYESIHLCDHVTSVCYNCDPIFGCCMSGLYPDETQFQAWAAQYCSSPTYIWNGVFRAPYPHIVYVEGELERNTVEAQKNSISSSGRCDTGVENTTYDVCCRFTPCCPRNFDCGAWGWACETPRGVASA